MTERIYYIDAYATAFDAIVVSSAPGPTAGTHVVRLDRTAFYPTSGGQPHDLGTLDGVPVVDVIDAGDERDGDVLHVVEGPAPAGAVAGRIDWPRRFDHMQQHTGQHILSAAFDRVVRAATVSFHLGTESATIDLAREVVPDEIRRAESEANRIVWENRPVAVRFAEPEEVAALPLRKESTRRGRLRLVDVHEFDLSACGGTHVGGTGAVGVIAVAGWERLRGATRVEFLCGGRALAGYRALREVVTGATRLLSVLPADLPAGTERLQLEVRDGRATIKSLQVALAAHRAEALSRSAETIGDRRVVLAAVDGDVNVLKTMAAAIVERSGHAAVVVNRVSPINIVIARAADVPLDSAAVLKALIARFGGKGGGRPEMAQGGGLAGPADAIVTAAREAVADRLPR